MRRPPTDDRESRYRKHGPLHLGRRTYRAIRDHPANAGRVWPALLRAARWQLRKRLRRSPLDYMTSRGYTIRCYSDSNSASHLFYFGEWFDFHEMHFVYRYLNQGDRMIDAGANIGTYALLAASIVGPDGHVDAFEPHHTAFARLVENVELNGYEEIVACHRSAVGAADGDVDFLSDMDVSNRVVHERHLLDRRYDRVPCTTLDSLLSSDNYAFAKIDVEGLELDVLRGAQQGLRRGDPPVIQLELLPGVLRKAGSSVEQVVELLSDTGYDLCQFDAHRGILTRLSAPPHGNAFAIWRPAFDAVERAVRRVTG